MAHTCRRRRRRQEINARANSVYAIMIVFLFEVRDKRVKLIIIANVLDVNTDTQQFVTDIILCEGARKFLNQYFIVD